MHLVDFKYGHNTLSKSFSSMVCHIETSPSISDVMVPTMSLETYSNNETFKREILRSGYEDVLSATFDIAKDPCLLSYTRVDKNDPDAILVTEDNKDEVRKYLHNIQVGSYYARKRRDYYTPEEVKLIMATFNSRIYHKFYPIYNDGSFENLYYYGTFTDISIITLCDKTIGFTLTFTSSSPYAYNYKVVNVQNTKTFSCPFYSDVDGEFVYPYNFVLTCKNNGDYIIENDRDKYYGKDPTRTTIIRNCKAGEVITMNPREKTISSRGHDKLFNDFNYTYPRLVTVDNITEDRPGEFSEMNNFTINLPCDVKVEWEEINKVGIIS